MLRVGVHASFFELGSITLILRVGVSSRVSTFLVSLMVPLAVVMPHELLTCHSLPRGGMQQHRDGMARRLPTNCLDVFSPIIRYLGKCC